MGTRTSNVALTDDALRRISANCASLAPGPRHVAQLVLDDPKRAVNSSVTEFAAVAGTSTSTVVRTCQQLGYRGFQHLKLAVARSLGVLDHADRNVNHSTAVQAIEHLPLTVLRHAQHALADAAATLSQDAFEGAVGALARSRRTLLVGAGTTYALAYDAAHSLNAIGHAAEAPAELMALQLAASRLRPTDTCVAISATGSTNATLGVAELAVESGAVLIAMTSYARSPLGELASHTLAVGNKQGLQHLSGSGARVAIMVVVHAICRSLALQDPARSSAALRIMEDVNARNHR